MNKMLDSAIARGTLLIVPALILVAGCTSETAASSMNSASSTVHRCSIAPGFTTPQPVAIPSVVNSTYNVSLPADASFYSAQDTNGNIPYFFVGPSSASCSATYGGDGSQSMIVTDKSTDATIYVELAPSGITAGYQDACSVFPDLADLISDDADFMCSTGTNTVTSDLTSGLAPDSVDVSMAQGAHVGLLTITAGDAPQELASLLGASSRLTVLQLSVVDLWTDKTVPSNPVPGFFIRSSYCAAPSSDAALCVASFDYFLAEESQVDGVKLPNANAVDALIKDQIEAAS
jgi:hypothetical protein